MNNVSTLINVLILSIKEIKIGILLLNLLIIGNILHQNSA
jgi:hypothetical protein